MQIKHASPIVWMSVSLLLALWAGYVAGGVLLRYGTARYNGPPLKSLTSQTNSQTTTTAKGEPAASSSKAAPPAPEVQPPSPAQPPRQPILEHGAVGSSSATVLQVAALTRQTDATALAEVLSKKGFAAFVSIPTTDKFYRVQIGPFPDRRSAGTTVDKLRAQGFQVFMKNQ